MNELQKVVKFPMYNYQVTIVITDDLVESRNNRSDKIGTILTDFKFTTGLSSRGRNNDESFIFISCNGKELSTLVHETNHTVWNMMEYIGADLESEIFAYTQTYLFEKGQKLINKWNRKHQLNP